MKTHTPGGLKCALISAATPGFEANGWSGVCVLVWGHGRGLGSVPKCGQSGRTAGLRVDCGPKAWCWQWAGGVLSPVGGVMACVPLLGLALSPLFFPHCCPGSWELDLPLG